MGARWRINNMLLKQNNNNNKKTRVNGEIKEEIRKYLETSENKSTTLENLWNTTKAVLRGKFIAIQN